MGVGASQHKNNGSYVLMSQFEKVWGQQRFVSNKTFQQISGQKEKKTVLKNENYPIQAAIFRWEPGRCEFR